MRERLREAERELGSVWAKAEEVDGKVELDVWVEAVRSVEGMVGG